MVPNMTVFFDFHGKNMKRKQAMDAVMGPRVEAKITINR